ncbi:MAG: hypothetical protein JWN32_3721 [Solirubrobacterales bacterium]|jgi:uncharacterized protein YdeI (YjbR/CyaY-like superfamily)|nr:hypothetical protein [Solirubrobacterales bacterium]
MEPTFFPTPAEWRAWLEANHETETEVLVGFYKKGSDRPSITWPESVDQALCFGWIDGVRRSLGEDAYTIRFTPRKATSNWSAVNVKRFGELHAAELVAPAGHAAFERRREDRTAIYAYEQEGATLPEEYENRLRANAAAWDYFSSRPPWYRRTAIHWVVRAKREETRERRLNQLIEDSANGRTIGPLTRPGAEQASA